ncbi:MAG: dienelactone hydrolase family protein [Acidimicrobiales bacterium]
MDEPTERFRDQTTVLGGITGEVVEMVSANPTNFHQAVTDPDGCEPLRIDGKLFVPSSTPAPLVMVIPGSLGVGPNHLAHAETMLDAGYAAFVLDPFGPRAVVSTVANQTQYSFAASAFDVLAALRHLREHPAIDPARISAQGHSRGGSAVLTASMRRFADPIVGPDVGLAGTFAVYPWAGYQFVDPTVGSTAVRCIVGEQDDWVSVQQVQSQAHAIALAGGTASCRVVAGAAHSFDRREAVHRDDDARVAPAAPTVHLDDDGAMIDPRSGVADPALTDMELFLAAIEAGYGRKGAHLGGLDGQPELFEADMMSFHRSVLG